MHLLKFYHIVKLVIDQRNIFTKERFYIFKATYAIQEKKRGQSSIYIQ